MDVRKDILRKLERKKKHSNMLHDELYHYLERFPEEKSNLEKEVLKTKKNPIFELEDKQKYDMPSVEARILEPKGIKE